MIPARSEFSNQSDHRIWTCATIAKAIRRRGTELGLIGGDCYSDPPPIGCSLEFEHLVVAFAVGLPPAIVRHEKQLALRMVRSYLATSTLEVREGDDE